jgi:hypothetical protein
MSHLKNLNKSITVAHLNERKCLEEEATLKLTCKTIKLSLLDGMQMISWVGDCTEVSNERVHQIC